MRQNLEPPNKMLECGLLGVIMVDVILAGCWLCSFINFIIIVRGPQNGTL
jgi:hypothetical protein